jgi:hypothetical protein
VNTRRLVRAVGSLLAAATLLLPSGIAAAADDPEPLGWPEVQKPDTGGDQSNPAPGAWPQVAKPDTTGSGADPEPFSWPAPQAG